MQQFTRRIFILDERYALFYFIRVYTISGLQYIITVSIQPREHFIFHMEEKVGQWKIIELKKLPRWIMEVEERLAQAIMDENAKA